MKATTNKPLDPIEQRMRRGRRIARIFTLTVLVTVAVTAVINPGLFSADLKMPSAQEREEAKKSGQKKRASKPKRRLSPKDIERLAKLRRDRARKHVMEILRRLEKRIVIAEAKEAEVTAKFREDPRLFDSLKKLIVTHANKIYRGANSMRYRVIRPTMSQEERTELTNSLMPLNKQAWKLSPLLREYQKAASPEALEKMVSVSRDLVPLMERPELRKYVETQWIRYAKSIDQNGTALKTQNKDLAVRGFAQPEDHPLTTSERKYFEKTLQPMTMASLHQLSQEMAYHYKNLMGDVDAGQLAEVADIPLPEALDKLAHQPYAKDDMQDALQQGVPANLEELDALTEALGDAQASAGRALQESGGKLPGAQGEGEGEGEEGEGGDKSGDAEDGDGPFGSGGGNGTENSNQQGDPTNMGQKSDEEILRALALRSDLSAAQDRSRKIQVDKERVLANVLPGRRFTADSHRKGYLFIDTWHIIGPWDAQSNGGRQIDYSKIYPLERKIDLDAIYTTGKKHFIYNDERGYAGSDERSGRLTWQFYQSPTVEVRIPRKQLANDGLYFAYTEVYFEQETIMNLAIGSDDAARIRVNGNVVFEDRGLSPYVISEQVRQVKFKQGVNKILVRLVNGPGPCRFSLLLVPQK